MFRVLKAKTGLSLRDIYVLFPNKPSKCLIRLSGLPYKLYERTQL